MVEDKKYQDEAKDYIKRWSNNPNIDTLRLIYDHYNYKQAESQAEWFHNMIIHFKQWYLETTLVSVGKNEMRLFVVIRERNEEYKHKENTHEQETDI